MEAFSLGRRATLTDTRTTCPYCGVGCGVVVERFGEHFAVSGDNEHPANLGRLCSKGAQLASTVNTDDRPDQPVVNGVSTPWDTALDYVAERFWQIIESHGSNSVALYASGQLLTEDYYVANKFVKGAIGSGNIDTNSRLCMASAVAGHKRAFGSDTVTCGYRDIERADLVILVGSNLAWCHPVLNQRLLSARTSSSTPVIVVIDPRETPTCANADLHLPVLPGTDAVLFNALLAWLDQQQAIDTEFIQNHVDGFAESLLAARAHSDLSESAKQCGLPVVLLERFFKLFLESNRVVTVFSQGVNQSSVGTDKVNAIINAHLASGKIGREGAGPFSVTGQPNAMGGREVGGLANQLAAHMGFDAPSVDCVKRFWGFDRIADKPGLPATEMFDAIASGEIKAVWIMGTNPAVSLPRGRDVHGALKGCDLVVVSDCVADTETIRLANVVLPVKGWGEKDGTVTNSERCISRQRAFIVGSGDARADWQVIASVARRMGFDKQFSFRNSADIFREHAALSGFENYGKRDFDISALAELSDDQYDELTPTYWPYPKGQAPTRAPVEIFSSGRFYTENQRAKMVPIRSFGVAKTPSLEFSLLLNTGRVRDQWHTMTRTARSTRLNRHSPEPYVEVHPLDARQHQLRDGDIASVRSQHGEIRVRTRTTRAVTPGHVFAPIHWSSIHASHGRVGTLFSGEVDPHSSQPELKSEPVALGVVDIKTHALLVHRNRSRSWPAQVAYSARADFGDCTVDFLGFQGQVFEVWTQLRAELSNANEILEREWTSGARQTAVIVDDALDTVLLVSPAPTHKAANWVSALFEVPTLGVEQRRSLLRGAPILRDIGDGDGQTLCACEGTTIEQIERLVSTGIGNSEQAIQELTGAGSHCGSCLPEIKQIAREE